MHEPALPLFQHHRLATGAQRRAQRAPRINAPSARIGFEAPRLDPIIRHLHLIDQPARAAHFIGRHLREILALQNLALGHCEPRIEFDLLFLDLFLLRLLEQRLRRAQRSGIGLFIVGRRSRRMRRQRCNDFLD